MRTLEISLNQWERRENLYLKLNGNSLSHHFLPQLLWCQKRTLSNSFVELVNLVTQSVSQQVTVLSSAVVFLHKTVIFVLCVLTNASLDLQGRELTKKQFKISKNNKPLQHIDGRTQEQAVLVWMSCSSNALHQSMPKQPRLPMKKKSHHPKDNI